MTKQLIVIGVIIVIVLLASQTILGQFSSLHLIGSRGTVTVKGVETYWDQNLANKTEAINWGAIYLGSPQNVTLYIRSISNIETTLNLNTTNWNPTNLSDYMNLTWNYNGTTIQPGEIIQVTLTLSASSSNSFILYLIINDVKDFYFDIIIGVNEEA